MNEGPNESEYCALHKACDRLLLMPDAGVERIAIPWLHVIRPHPIFFSRYSGVFSPYRSSLPYARVLRNLGSAIRHLGKAAVSGGPAWVGDAPERSDVLFISHLVNASFAGRENDFYFGDAAAGLADKGISSTLALINYTRVRPAALAASWRQPKAARVVISPVLGFPTELGLYRRALAEAKRLRAEAALATTDLERRVVARAILEATGGGTVGALRLGEQIKALVARLRPRAIVVTYEGHSWERVAFAAARAIAPDIVCIGYQHAALFNLQHAVQRRLGAAFNPDVILTSGRISKTRLEANPELAGVRTAVMGSNRSFARKPAKPWRLESGEKRTCIVLPEGAVGECNLLFGFSLKCAREMPDLAFIWRLHPNMNYDMLMKQNPDFRDLPPNVTLSTRTLEEDVAQSHWGLYRSSSAIVQAGVSGVRPVYLHVPGEIRLDTLHGIGKERAEVVELSDFKDVIAAAEMDESGSEAARRKVQDYCEQIFTPMDVSALVASVVGDPNNGQRSP